MTPFVKNALTLLNADRLSDAITYIRKRLIADRNTRALDNINSIDSTYTFLLKYLADGKPDPDRIRMYADIREKLYSIVRSIEVEQEMKDSPLLFYTHLRNNDFSKRNFSEAFGRFISASSEELFTDDEVLIKKCYEEKDQALKDIFSIVWTLPIGYSEELKSISSVAAGRDTDPELAALIISALTLNLLTIYDREKFIILLDLLGKDLSNSLEARLLTGILLILSRYPKRVANDPQIISRFDIYVDSPAFMIKIKDVIYSLVKARGGINLMHRIESEILPDIMKMGPEMVEKLKNNNGEIDLDSLEMNPEWEKIVNGKMGKKLRKLSDLQSDGGDVMLSMFSKLVNNFYFFNDIDVWFRTFTSWEAKRLGASDGVISAWEALPKNAGMCDVDKYAMALNLARLPQAARDMMAQGMDAQAEQLKEELKSREILDQNSDFEMEVANYTRILFRFYNFFRLRSEFNNPFAAPINIEELPFIGNIIADEDTLSEIGEYYFRQGFYSDSISVFKSLSEISPLERYLYCQKIGFAYEKLKDYPNALKYYTDYSLENNHDIWLLKKIRLAAKEVGDLKYLNYALTILNNQSPDDITYLKELIGLKLANSKYDRFLVGDDMFESDKLISRAYYLAPDDEDILLFRAKRGLANGDFEKVEESVSSGLSEISLYLAASSLSSDIDASSESAEKEEKMSEYLLIAGSVELAKGDVASAINLFSQTLLLKNADIKRSQLRDRLLALWATSLPLSDHIPMLPLYLEAIYRK